MGTGSGEGGVVHARLLSAVAKGSAMTMDGPNGGAPVAAATPESPFPFSISFPGRTFKSDLQFILAPISAHYESGSIETLPVHQQLHQ
jgi:hypothetical protein